MYFVSVYTWDSSVGNLCGIEEPTLCILNNFGMKNNEVLV